MPTLRWDDPLAVDLAGAIQRGDLASLGGLLASKPELALARIVDARGTARTTLHVAADWPGHFRNGPRVVRALIAAGAEVSAPIGGCSHQETPLHWAASSDDVEVADELIAGGADLEASGGTIAAGTPLDDAVGYGQWQVARLLVERGARVEKLWHAAALGMTSYLEAQLTGPAPPPPERLNEAFWQACHGGQRRAAEYLLSRGADPTWRPHYSRHSAIEVAAGADGRRDGLVTWLKEQASRPTQNPD